MRKPWLTIVLPSRKERSDAYKQLFEVLEHFGVIALFSLAYTKTNFWALGVISVVGIVALSFRLTNLMGRLADRLRPSQTVPLAAWVIATASTGWGVSWLVKAVVEELVKVA